MSVKHKIAAHLQCNHSLNRRALCLKRSWDEVASILNRVCDKKCCNDRHKRK